MKRFLIVSMVVGLTAGSVATAEAEHGYERVDRTVEVSYQGSGLFVNALGSCGAGCVRIDPLPTEDSLKAVVMDVHGQPVVGWVMDASENPLDGSKVYGSFCGQTIDPIRFDPGTKLALHVGTWWPTWSETWFIPGGLGCLPGLATTGTIRVTLSGWKASEESTAPSDERVKSPAPQPSATAQPASVERSVQLSLRRHLRTAGSVVSADPSCRSEVPVVIERAGSSGWVEVGSTTTDPEGVFALKLNDRSGRYRALAPETRLPERTCLSGVSTIARHRH